MIVKYIKDSILNTDLTHIAHGVNCQGKMGSGVAKVLFDMYPQVRSEYLDFYKRGIHTCINGQEDFLGTIQPVKCDNKIIFNCFTQEFYGYDKKLYVSYDHVREIFNLFAEHYPNESIAIPKIGCGLAGGDWEVVSKIIDECTKNGPDIHVYHLD